MYILLGRFCCPCGIYVCQVLNTSYLIQQKVWQGCAFYISILLIAGISFSYSFDEISLLLTSTYGNLLLAKILFVAGLLAFGAFNKNRITHSILNDFQVSSKRLFSSINIEIILACSIFFLTSLLTTSVMVP